MNHKFTKEVLTKTYKSSTLSLAANNLIKDKAFSFDLVKNIDKDFVLNSIKTMLDILEKEDQTVEVDDTHAYQIKEYLLLLDLIMEVDKLSFPNIGNKQQIIAISQPGLRYAQTKAVVEALLLDEKFNDLSAVERQGVIDRVMSSILGRMMEELVLLETKPPCPHTWHHHK